MAASHENEMENLQRLSDHWQAELPGPLIGQKLPMNVLVTEYAQADPAYVVKTTGLAATHSGYRPIKGDGQCGWRGAVFGYFELLLESQDLSLIQIEEIRVKSFSDTMAMAGMDTELLEMMFESTFELFEDLKKAFERGEKNEDIILRLLNDTQGPSDNIVYHFKTMTSAYMSLRPDNYEPFLEMPLDEYRVRRIDPARQEIDQIGLQALTDGVIGPSGFGLEVLYLDRSTGEEVTPHQFAQGHPTIRMLYRPGHYDMIYREGMPTQVFAAPEMNFSQGVEVGNNIDMSNSIFTTLYSAYSDPWASRQHGLGNEHCEHNHQPYSRQSSVSRDSNTKEQVDSTRVPATLNSIQEEVHSPQSLPSPCSSTYISNPMTPGDSVYPSPATVDDWTRPNAEPLIRLNHHCWNYESRHESLPLTTAGIAQGANQSSAHFLNDNFQPRLWFAGRDSGGD